MTLGKRFKQLRIENKLTQQELVDNFNIKYAYQFSKSAISQYENDRRKPEVQALIHFASYFDVSVDYLLGINDVRKIEINNKIIDNNLVFEYIQDLFSDNEVSRYDKDMLFKEISNLYFKSLKTNI